jgi:glucose-1-phosphate thymidylyltransferase
LFGFVHWVIGKCRKKAVTENRKLFEGEYVHMDSTLKILVPMAGLGTRLRPHTWSKPKPLISVAGKAVLGHVLDMFSEVPHPENIEYIFIVGYLGEQIEKYVQENYPQLKAHYVVQEEMRGQSHAVYLAKEYLQGPVILTFVDTLIEADLSFLEDEPTEGIVCVKPVEDPRRFGVATVNDEGYVQKLIEKPQDMENNLAVVGFYYFKRAEELLEAIEEQMRLDIQLKNEFFLADAINIMLERGLEMRTQPVDVWLDAGTSETVLETNRYLLDHSRDNSREAARQGVLINPPVYIHPSAHIVNSVIGPYVSLGADCYVESSILRDSILSDGAQVVDVILEKSLIGQKGCIHGRPRNLNAGDQTEVVL